MVAGGRAERFLELDGLRALAALMVVIAHIAEFDKNLGVLITSGPFGVMLFFVLSGFLMGTLYLQAPFTREGVAKYAVARAIRIAPIYLIVVIASYFITMAWPSFAYNIHNGNLLRHLMFSGNIKMFWTIPPEVQFYGVFLVIWWAAAIYRTQNLLLPLVVVAAMVLTFVSFHGFFPGTFVGTHIQFFVGGVIAALLRPRLVVLMKDRQALIFAQVFLLLLFAWTSFSPTTPFRSEPNVRYLGDGRAVVSVLMVLLMSIPSAVSTPLFANSWMRAVGAWSFSLYLVNLAVFQVASFLIPVAGEAVYAAVGVSGSIALSALTYRLIEKPSQAFKPAIQSALVKFLETSPLAARRGAPDAAP